MPIRIEHPYDQRPFFVVGDEVRPLVRAGTHELFEVAGPEGSGPPPHAHPWNESYVVLDGKLIVAVDGEEHILSPGQVVHIQAGVTHLYKIAAPRTRFLATTSGDKASAFFADVDANVTPGIPTPASLPELISVAKRNRLTSPLF
jgi:quercetin dioxygenase-like cupin family protein